MPFVQGLPAVHAASREGAKTNTFFQRPPVELSNIGWSNHRYLLPTPWLASTRNKLNAMRQQKTDHLSPHLPHQFIPFSAR